jgi:phage tail sheath protein FI
VWNAPANLTVNGVQGPAAVLTDTGQAPLNVPLNGESVCILRSVPGRGTVVWGARTLDGNSADYRYIQVRRTLIYIEQSIGSALPAYSFAANDATTWAAVTQAIGNFLTGLWQSGGLIGSKPSEAFSVECGVGTTMTAEDVLNGVMRVGVTVQMVHPAEFIELTFTQSMAS